MHRFEQPIHYDETDLSGAVYHANYLKYFSRGRELFLGLDKMQQQIESGLFFVVHKVNIRYRRPAQFGDTLTIETDCTQDRPPRLRFIQRALRGEELICEAEVELALIDDRGRPVRNDTIIDFGQNR